ncbi:RNA polymerase sigma factor [Microterricola pindariensis]|uniref:RNA polymerase subunit sigma-70 n=1 Tax=Microterricola pindariensis TaxID=478010 RepID=A0ABX5AR53_9MICO|nr:RNA polymerase sigma factor [Microterricola pindariensis]PPL14575.1 hypothetical protein GY24_15950 [Microterricola pindariensis]
MSTSDEDDWALACAGDSAAFGALFDRHHARVLRHCLRLVPQAHEAEDVAAMVFLECWRKRRQVRFVDGSLLPWLLVTATNVARNASRSARRYHALLARLPVPEESHRPDDAVDEDVRAAFLALSGTDREILTLRVLEGFSEAEAARALGIALGTAKSRLARAKARLAAGLGEADVPAGFATPAAAPLTEAQR